MSERLNTEQQEFINELSHKMKTQDNRCTAQPYGLVIRNEITTTGIGTDYTDNVGAIWDGELYETFEDFMKCLKDNGYTDALEAINKADCSSFSDLNYCTDPVVKNLELQVTGYEKEMRADASAGCMHGNFFLTEDAAHKFIESNKHNLTNPDTFGIHLYRNPEMEMLYNIIHALADDKA